MDASTPMPADLQRQQDRKRKRKAILAGGVVLGLGAAVTLAAWSDDVFADGFFNTGTFELEGSADGVAWAPHDAAGNAAALYFNSTPSSSTNARSLQYNETVWAPLSIRLSADTTTDGTYVLTDVTFPGSESSTLRTANGLDYIVYSGIENAVCSALADGATPATGAVWASGTVGTAPASITPTALTANAAGTDGVPDNLCLGVTLNSNDQQFMGQDATEVQWQFTATADTE
ncbi:SipW-dependent-type signal peptide-containing protein [Dietzia aurantiaca]|uniref:SipW-dependent-type signal peptide-containing protein n=1 Tax=Dietzia aurantiaca TaxID=983873 RepID=A0ABV9PNX3_9ACTN